MRKRRRRRWRDEVIAPWLTLVVVLGLWWVGAKFITQAAFPPSAPGAAGAPGATGAPRAPGARGAPGARAEEADRRIRIIPELADDAVPVVDVAPEDLGGDEDGPIIPVAGVAAEALRSSFDEPRGGGARRHEAMDILAPRGTAVVAAVDGRVVKLFTSAAGGLTIYQFDTAEQFCYYYAHLDGYAPNLTEGQIVRRGQVIGSVGTTGNAPPDTPHLHFAIFRLGPEKRWWDGDPIDPIDVLR